MVPVRACEGGRAWLLVTDAGSKLLQQRSSGAVPTQQQMLGGSNCHAFRTVRVFVCLFLSSPEHVSTDFYGEERGEREREREKHSSCERNIDQLPPYTPIRDI